MKDSRSEEAYQAMADYLNRIASKVTLNIETIIEIIEELRFGTKMSDPILYKSCCSLINYLVTLESIPAKSSMIDFLLDALIQIYEKCRQNGDDATLSEVYLALGGIAAI